MIKALKISGLPYNSHPLLYDSEQLLYADGQQCYRWKLQNNSRVRLIKPGCYNETGCIMLKQVLSYKGATQRCFIDILLPGSKNSKYQLGETLQSVSDYICRSILLHDHTQGRLS